MRQQPFHFTPSPSVSCCMQGLGLVSMRLKEGGLSPLDRRRGSLLRPVIKLLLTSLLWSLSPHRPWGVLSCCLPGRLDAAPAVSHTPERHDRGRQPVALLLCRYCISSRAYLATLAHLNATQQPGGNRHGLGNQIQLRAVFAWRHAFAIDLSVGAL